MLGRRTAELEHSKADYDSVKKTLETVMLDKVKIEAEMGEITMLKAKLHHEYVLSANIIIIIFKMNNYIYHVFKFLF